jgi:hypothetical protein
MKIIFRRIRELKCLERIGLAQQHREIRRRLMKMCESGAQLTYPNRSLLQDSLTAEFLGVLFLIKFFIGNGAF